MTGRDGSFSSPRQRLLPPSISRRAKPLIRPFGTPSPQVRRTCSSQIALPSSPFQDSPLIVLVPFEVNQSTRKATHHHTVIAAMIAIDRLTQSKYRCAPTRRSTLKDNCSDGRCTGSEKMIEDCRRRPVLAIDPIAVIEFPRAMAAQNLYELTPSLGPIDKVCHAIPLHFGSQVHKTTHMIDSLAQRPTFASAFAASDCAPR